ncbi:MAG: TraR/DksA family transcriptional regulator [Desulfuromonadaceae bacterium]|nr:TraR/DksA family transcriptional regulator [Desulfuromonadaceae bacterium]
MATTTKATKATPNASTPEKKSAVKTKKAAVLPEKSPSVETPEETIPAAVEQAAPQTPQVTSQDPKWREIRLILEKMKEDALREIRKSVKKGTEAVAAIEPGGDIYDQASSERDRELGLLLGDREREKIHSIDEALLRIDEGEYGICEECDEDIPLGRLKAMPFTRHCVKCKSDIEKLQAQTKRVEEERAYREIPIGAEEEES